MTSSKPKGTPNGDYDFDTPPEATPLARAASVVAAILEITGSRDLTHLETRLHDPQIRSLLARAHLTEQDKEQITRNRGLMSLIVNTTPKTRLVLCPECAAPYLAGSGSIPKTCQTGPAGCDGVPYACSPANRVPHTGLVTGT